MMTSASASKPIPIPQAHSTRRNDQIPFSPPRSNTPSLEQLYKNSLSLRSPIALQSRAPKPVPFNNVTADGLHRRGKQRQLEQVAQPYPPESARMQMQQEDDYFPIVQSEQHQRGFGKGQHPTQALDSHEMGLRLRLETSLPQTTRRWSMSTAPTSSLPIATPLPATNTAMILGSRTRPPTSDFTLSSPGISSPISSSFKCPNPNCTKSYRHANGLIYHMTHDSCNFIPPDGIEHANTIAERKKRDADSSLPVFLNETSIGATRRQSRRHFICGVGDCQKRYKNMNGLIFHYQNSDHGAIGLALLVSGQHECFSYVEPSNRFLTNTSLPMSISPRRSLALETLKEEQKELTNTIQRSDVQTDSDFASLPSSPVEERKPRQSAPSIALALTDVQERIHTGMKTSCTGYFSTPQFLEKDVTRLVNARDDLKISSSVARRLNADLYKTTWKIPDGGMPVGAPSKYQYFEDLNGDSDEEWTDDDWTDEDWTDEDWTGEEDGASVTINDDRSETQEWTNNQHVKVKEQNDVDDLLLHACNILKVVCSDEVKYRKLLDLERGTTQLVLDIIQVILDYNMKYRLDSQFENILLKAMLRLSKRSTLCPKSYVLSDIKRDEYPIAAGHFGEIYKGDYNGRKVSLKVFKLYSNQMSKINDLLKAFYKEAILWRHLVHPNLLPFYGIYQLGDSGGRICLVSPWMDNGNVIQYLQQYPDANRQQLILDIAQGVSYLHGKSFVHGDLKGVNVLISNNGVACLGDFGLSSIINTHSLAWTSMETSISNAGTVRWQAPELIDTEDKHSAGVMKETDIYAFACVCYEVLTGKIPFYQYTLDATVIFKVMSGQRPLRPESDPKYGLTDWMWSLIEECWNQDPIKRPIASDIVAKLYSRDEFVRDGVNNSSWGDLRPEMFKSLLNQHSLVSDADIQHSISLLSSL